MFCLLYTSYGGYQRELGCAAARTGKAGAHQQGRSHCRYLPVRGVPDYFSGSAADHLCDL